MHSAKIKQDKQELELLIEELGERWEQGHINFNEAKMYFQLIKIRAADAVEFLSMIDEGPTFKKEYLGGKDSVRDWD